MPLIIMTEVRYPASSRFFTGSSIGRTPDFGSGGWRFEPSPVSRSVVAERTIAPGCKPGSFGIRRFESYPRNSMDTPSDYHRIAKLLEDFPTFFEGWRKSRGVTQVEVFRGSGVHKQTLHSIKHGYTKPHLTTVIKLFRFMAEWDAAKLEEYEG